MKQKQIIIILCLVGGFGLLFYLWQRTGEQPVTETAKTPAQNANTAPTPVGTPAPPINLDGVSIGNAESPTEAYRMLYTAVKAKNTDAIKRMLSEKTLVFSVGIAAKQNTEINKFYENGLTATTFAPNLPRTRDQRIKDNMGALEVWNEKENRWEDLPFIKEADGWKLAVGDIFQGNYVLPAKGQAQIEMEATTNKEVPYGANTGGNLPPGIPMKPKN